MEIEKFVFGMIKIDGKKYLYDIVTDGRIVEKWLRKEGHKVCLEDIEKFLKEETEYVIFGTGTFGFMKVPESIKEKLKEKGIEVIVEKTSLSIKKFSEVVDKKKVIGFFHLTC
ncbi:hypothetical protein J7K25_00265 [bacterium]|nr:hypothetical protein [bacterium]